MEKSMCSAFLALLLVFFAAGCKQEKAVNYEVSVPQENTVKFEAELLKKYGIGIDGSFDIFDYGSIFVRSETPDRFFQFGFELHTGTFLKETWVNYDETTTLPNGSPMPSWISDPVVDVVIPPANIPELGWHFYFGTTQFYLGVAAVITAIDERFPALNIGYNFYEPGGNLALGLVFFGPDVDENGNLVSPGGIFVGTNISPFLPDDVRPTPIGDSAFTPYKYLNWDDLENALEAGSIEINGSSAFTDVRVISGSNSDKKKYRSKRKLKKLIKKFLRASRQ
jgi:hypothetical protein